MSTKGKTRLEFFQPPVEVGLAPTFIRAVLTAVGHEVDAAAIDLWTLPERLVAYDYAMRARIHADARAHECATAVELRPCPSFVIAADVYHGKVSFWHHLGEQRAS